MGVWIMLVFIITIASGIESSSLKLVKEAVTITSKYYKQQFVTAVVGNYNDTEEENHFLINYPGTVGVTRLAYNDNQNVVFHMQKNGGYQQTVYFATKTKEFEKFLKIVNIDLRVPIKMVLICKNIINDMNELLFFNKIAWINNLADFIIISEDSNGIITVSTYFPYKNDVCGNCNPVKLDNDDNLFPKKFTNFNTCPIRAAAIPFQTLVHLHYKNGVLSELSGHDGLTLMEIKNKLNTTLQYIELPKSYGLGTYVNGIASGAMYDLLNNKTDIVVPAGILSLGRYSASQISHIYHELDVRWIGPKRREIYQYTKVLIPFFNIISPLIFLAYLLFVGVATLVSRWMFSLINKKINICFDSFTLLVGQTANVVTMVPMLNYLFLLWMWFTFIVRIIYQGYLVDSLQTPILEPPFEDIEESIKRVDGYGGTQIMIELYKNTSLESGFTLFPLSEFYSYVKDISEGKRFLVASDKFLVRQVRNSVQILPRQITSTWSCFYMRPGWPAAPAIDSIVVRLTEAGFMLKLLSEDSRVQNSKIKKDEGTHALNMAMLSACFYMMAFMSLVSFIIFLLEIFYHRYGNRRKNYIV